MQKVIVLGGGPLQLPAISYAKELGFYVICVDYDPRAVGFRLADKSENISTLDVDAVMALAESEGPDFVITSASDAPVRIAAYVSEQLGLPTGISYEDAICATFKDAMRNRLKEHGIPMPEYLICETYEDFESAVNYFGFNCVAKPADSAASRGVRMVSSKNSDDLERLFAESIAFSRKGTLMVEECVYGPEVSVEALTVDGFTTVAAITDKLVTDPPYFVELGHSEQSMLSEAVKKEIAELAKRTVAAIGMSNGPSHTEIKVTPQGPKVIETAARLGGDYITSKLVPLSTGVDLVRSSVALSLGKAFDADPKRDKGSAIRFITSDCGTIGSITIEESLYDIPGFEELELYKDAGDEISSPHSSNDRIGHVICSGPDARTAISAAESALAKVKVDLMNAHGHSRI